VTGDVAGRRPAWRSQWWMPAVCLVLGGLMFAALAIGGNVADGAGAFGVMAVIAAMFAFVRRSDTLQGLAGPGRDERWAAIDVRATAIAGMTLIAGILGGWLWELAHGNDGSPYGQLAALGGVAYVIAVAVLRTRT